jgi:DNA-directed RNA polymerase specialized sigma24 family protein
MYGVESFMENIPDETEQASLENLVITSERNEKVLEYVNRYMTKRFRKCVLLSLEGLSAQEIADKLVMSLSTVRTYISKGAHELREHIDDSNEIKS